MIKGFFKSKDIQNKEKLVEILDHTRTKLTICAVNDNTDCHGYCIEGVLLINALVPMVLKNTPNWPTFLEMALDVLDNVGQITSQFDNWTYQDASTAAFNCTQVIKSFLETGKVPTTWGRGSFGSKAISNIKAKSSKWAPSSTSSASDEEGDIVEEPTTSKKLAIKNKVKGLLPKFY